jgi:hypothetical protein
MKNISREDRREEMFGIVEAFKTSGQSRKAFCATRSIPLSLFYYWQRKYFQHHQEDIEKSFFVPVSANGRVSSKSNLQEITLQYPNGVCLALPLSTSPSVIRSLILLI